MTSLHDRLPSRAPDVSEIAFPYCGAIGVLHDLVACEAIYSIKQWSKRAPAPRMKQAPLLLNFLLPFAGIGAKAHVQQRFPKESTIELDLTCATACRIHNKRMH